MNKQHEIEVSTHIHFSRILISGFVTLGIVVGVFVVVNQRDIRGKAQGSPHDLPILPVTQELTAPYLRLGVVQTGFSLREKIPVGVYLHSGGLPVMESRIVVTYDSDVVELTADQIKLEPGFQTIQVESIERGKVVLVVFINPTTDQKPVIADNEIRIASLAFSPREVTTGTQIAIESGEIVEYSTARADEITNLLKSAAGIEIQIKP